MIGSKKTFRYGYYGTPDSCPNYSAHRGQIVDVIRTLTSKECDAECGPMYLIRAADGWEGHANMDELMTGDDR